MEPVRGMYMYTISIQYQCHPHTLVSTTTLHQVDFSNRGNAHYYNPDRLVAALLQADRLFPELQSLLLQAR
jgi:hypothetical protein